METTTRTSSFSAPRRVMTAPIPRTVDPPSSTQSTGGLVETLYNHPNAKIIAFSAQGKGRARSPGRAQPDEEPGSLAWSSGLERTIAVGPFRIYRAPGSVAFLNCGSALQPILPKSQCWCIDEVSSKFVLQIRKPNYWRIEVPIESPHDQDLAHAMRVVLDQILQFEKTPCPFKRAFTVQLPARPSTPVVKKPWMPVYGPLPPLSTPEFSTSPTPTPKSLRSAEKKPQARRSSAAMERPPVKESSDVEEDVSPTRSAPIPKPVETTEEEPASSPIVEDQKEEDRGRTLAREEVVAALPELVSSAAAVEEKTPVVEATPEATTSTVEETSQEIEIAPEAEATSEEHLTENVEDDVSASPSEKLEEASVEVSTETPAKETRDEPAESVLEAPVEDIKTKDAEAPSLQATPEFDEPWSAHSVDTPRDMEPATSEIADEPWSAHSTEPFLISEASELRTEDFPETETAQEKTVTDSDEDAESDAGLPATEDDTITIPAAPIAEAIRDPATLTSEVLMDKAEDVKPNNSQPASTIVQRRPPLQTAAATSTKRLSLISDKFDGIPPYEQKSAASTSTSLDVASRVTGEISNESSPDDEKKSSFSDELSLSSSPEETFSAGPLEGETHEGSGTIGARRKKKLRAFHGSRSLAVPPQLTLVTSPPSKSAAPKRSPTQPEQSAESTSPTGSQDSFHSVQSWHSAITPLPPSPPASDPTTPSTFPYPHNNILMPKRVSRYEMSDMTVTPETRRTWDAASYGTQESSQESAATAPDVVIGEFPVDKPTQEADAVSTALAPTKRPDARHRATTSTVSRRALSPLPPAANLFSPTSTTSRRRPNRSPLELVRRVPMAIVAKTCEILLSPPSHLINLMLRVAAKIAAGEWRGMVFGYTEGGEAIPVQWDYSDGELSDDDDGYTVRPSEGPRAIRERHVSHSVASGRSWEVD